MPTDDVERPVGVVTGSAAYASDVVADVLRGLGHRYLPMNPGSSWRGLHDSVVNHLGNRDPQLLLCLHEEIAVAMAHGYAKATGGPAAAVVHDLVGLMHATMAVYNAWADAVPVLVIGGGGPADPALRRAADWLHSATSQAELVRPFVKWAAEPTTGQATVDSLVRAHRAAVTAPAGPAYVSVDLGVQEQPLRAAPVVPPAAAAAAPPAVGAAQSDVERAAELLVGAGMPIVVGGRVGLDPAATAPLVELVELLAAGYHDDRNVVCFPTAHTLNCTGDRGLVADADVVLAVDVADLSALLGRHRPSSHRAGAAGSDAETSVIDVSLRDLALSSWSNADGPAVARAVVLAAEAVPTLQALTEAVRRRLRDEPSSGRTARGARRETLRERHAATRQRSHDAVKARADERPVAPSRLVTEVWSAVRDRDWLLVLRNTRSWPHGVWEFAGAGQYLGHSGGGGVGYGAGGMVGGALAARDRGQLAVAIIGDGDLLMGAGALWTAVHYGIPLLVVVNNNMSFYNDELHQREVAHERGRPEDNAWIGMRIDHPAIDIATLARSYGAHGEGPVTEPDDIADALRRAVGAVDAGGVGVVDVRTAAQ